MKKVLAILLAAVMLFSLTACGKKNETGAGKAAPTMTYLYNEGDAHKAIGEYMQSALAAAGLKIQLESQEWNTFLNTRKEGNYTIARNGWLGDYNDPISFLDMWITASGNNDCQLGKGAHKDVAIYDLDMTKWGGSKVENGTWAQTYDVIIGMIKKESDNAKRLEMMHAAEDLLMSTGTIVPIYYYTDLYMIDDSVKGFFSSPLGYKYFSGTTVEGKDALNVCLASEPDTIDPALNSAVDGATLVSHLFAGLAKWAQDDKGQLVIVADCAEELVAPVVNDDGTVTYTYTLREGLKWSDGKELKASDFEFAWKRAADPETAADYGYMFDVVKGYAENDLAVTADDAARTITVTLSNSVAYWNELLAFPTYFPVRKDVVEDESWATKPETYISNGAYTMKAWEHDSLITLQKNDNFIDADKVTMPTLNFYLSDDANNMLANFKKGDWLMIDDVPTNEIATLKKDYPNEFVIAGQLGTYYVCFNVNETLGLETEEQRAEVRKAIALLLDRNYICESIAQGGQVPASSFVAMGLTDSNGKEFYQNAGDEAANGYIGYFDVSPEAFEGNCEKAVEILKKYYKLEVAD
ncbi:MAG: peptide ABC transporter substrate-binding protein [Clostridia bacterium]|nr:peptide ABC transporter substrate-binding protein [Clostridia bacterium]